MLNPAPAAGLRLQPPSNDNYFPLWTVALQASPALYPVFILFVHHKSSADAKEKKQANVNPQTGTKSSTCTCGTQGFPKADLLLFLNVLVSLALLH